jgi:hypothetical protein
MQELALAPTCSCPRVLYARVNRRLFEVVHCVPNTCFYPRVAPRGYQVWGMGVGGYTCVSAVFEAIHVTCIVSVYRKCVV